MIRVLEGKLRYCIELPPSDSILEAAKPGVIEPVVGTMWNQIGRCASNVNVIKLRMRAPALDVEDQPARPWVVTVEDKARP